MSSTWKYFSSCWHGGILWSHLHPLDIVPEHIAGCPLLWLDQVLLEPTQSFCRDHAFVAAVWRDVLSFGIQVQTSERKFDAPAFNSKRWTEFDVASSSCWLLFASSESVKFLLPWIFFAWLCCILLQRMLRL